MAENANVLPPADWYEDPRDASLQRYWNGQAWTAETRPVPGNEPAAAAPATSQASAGAGSAAVGTQAAAAAGSGLGGPGSAGDAGGAAGVGVAGGGLGAAFGQGTGQGVAAAPQDAGAQSPAGPDASAQSLGGPGLGAQALGAQGTAAASGTGPLGEGGPSDAGLASFATELGTHDVASESAGTPAESVRPDAAEILVTTTGEIAGRAIARVLGDVCGVAVRDPGSTSDQRTAIAARRLAVGRMQEDALAAGANAVVGMRFDSAPGVGGGSEVAAYGTAVVADPA